MDTWLGVEARAGAVYQLLHRHTFWLPESLLSPIAYEQILPDAHPLARADQ